MKLRFEPLAGHGRRGFVSGNESLDDWFSERAGQDQRRNLTRVVVGLEPESGRILGYYSLSAFSIGPDDFPPEVARKLPRYDAVPAVLIGRLARHIDTRGDGVGKLLVADAIKRVVAASETIGVVAIVVDAIDDTAAQFYESAGFHRFPEERARLYLPMATVRKALLDQ